MKRLFIFGLLAVVTLALVISAGPAQAQGPIGPFVVGGGDVPDPNPYIWQVSIGQQGGDDLNSHFCGGSLIADKWVLTAAHCVIGNTPDQDATPAGIHVIYGRRVLSQVITGAKVNVAQIIAHESYQRNNIGAGNDIALLELTTPITDNSLIIPLMTTVQEPTLGPAGTTATVTGWGGLLGYPPEDDGPAGGQQFPDVLQFVEIPLVDNQTCQQSTGNTIIDSMVCAGLAGGGKDSCQGDSGGPLVVPDGQGGYVQNGVVSFGNGCAAAGQYGIYTRVSSFIDWINGKISGGGPNTFVYLPVILTGSSTTPPANDFVSRVVAETNRNRGENGCPPLTMNNLLNQAAQSHSEDMALNDFFSHIGSDGSDPFDRMIKAGYQPSNGGENIAGGASTPERVVEGWMNSPGHRANILNCDYKDIGVGYSFLEDDQGNTSFNHYWTQVFGTP